MAERVDRRAAVGAHALWLAACRARESMRPDRLLDDPYAAHLAGFCAEDFQIGPDAATPEFADVLRSVVVDEFLRRAVLDYHLHTVVHLGAGLDTRPYRLSLPTDLRWVECDREPVLAYKALRLAHARARCRVTRVDVDLTDAGLRDTVLRRVARGVARGLIVCEDASPLTASGALQEMSARMPRGIKWWIVHAPHRAEPAGSAFIDALCADRWQAVACRPLENEARRLAPGRLRHLRQSGGAGASEMGAVWMLHRATDGANAPVR